MARRSLTATEHEEQVALFEWAALNEGNYPELGLLFAIPNGGLRNVVVARKLKEEGVKAGVPDICLPVARGRYHGLFIELKTANGRPSYKQVEWVRMLSAQGYYARICRGWTYARDVVNAYLAIGKEIGGQNERQRR